MMKVPGPVKALFDHLPLVTLPPYDASVYNPQKNHGDDVDDSLIVYSVDEEGIPLDPKCLATYGALVLIGQKPKVTINSPYISSAETLPILRGNNKVSTSFDQCIGKYEKGEKMMALPEFKLYRSLVESWLDDAWHATIMDADNSRIRDAIYAEHKEFPWPFMRIAARQLDDNLDSRFARSKQTSGDNYVCSANNLERVGMAITALASVISSPLNGDPTLIDILVFAYVWPVITFVPTSALATIIPPMLRQHAHEVRSFLINSSNVDKSGI